MVENQTDRQKFLEESFAEQKREKDYIVDRGLFADYQNGRVIISDGGYNSILIGPGRQTLLETIKERIRRLGEIELLDVGCGTGRFLIDCASIWSGAIRCHGLTAYRYSRVYRTSPFETTEDAIRRLDIDVRVGDAQRLADVYEQQFDLITAVRVAPYLGDPWSLIKGVHQVLKSGGVAYINRFLPIQQYNMQAVVGMSTQEVSDLYRYLGSDPRFEVRKVVDIVYQKLSPELNFPVVPLYPVYDPNRSSDGIQYRFFAA